MHEEAGSCSYGGSDIMLDLKYNHKGLDVITDPPPFLITSAHMNHEMAITFDFVAMSNEVLHYFHWSYKYIFL